MVAEQQLAAMEGRMKHVEESLGKLRGDMAEFARTLNEQKANQEDDLNKEFASHKLAMREIIEAARTEFSDIKQSLTNLHTATDAALKEVVQKVNDVENKGGGNSGNGWKAKGYIPIKSMVPKTFNNQEDQWRQWQDDVMDYFDSITPGMRKFLKEVELETEPVGEAWLTEKAGSHDEKVLGDQVQVWRALKSLTDGEARKVVTSVSSENGFRAWQKLHMRFGPSLSSKQGMVLMEFSAMVAKPAKNPTETRMLLTEMERRIKLVEDVTDEQISENHAKSVLVGILDPMTRQHTAMHHGKKSTCEQLKKVVLEFVNNVTPRKDDSAMQVGRVTEEEADECYQEEEQLGALGGWSQCYKCQGYGHLARECPSKGKGKSGPSSQADYGKAKGKGWQEQFKGKGKGAETSKGGSKGKGKKAPLYGSCWTCGGSHFASECPTKGKGKGGKGLNAVEEDWRGEDTSAQNVRALSSLTRAQDHVQKDDGWKLVNYVKNKRAQGEIKREKRERSGKVVEQPGGVVGSLRPLSTIEPEGVNSVQKQEWESIELAVDSGASETVIGEDMLTAVETKEGPASRRGVQYEVANGVRIPNLGEKSFRGYTDEGLRRSMKAQVCDVNKALLSVHKLVKAGNKVVFEDEGSYVEDKTTGERMWLQEKGGMYMLKMWVRHEGF